MWGLNLIFDVFLCLKGKPLEDAPEALITSTSDLDNRLSRLVSKVLSCKNHPAELNPTAMAQQLEEAEVRLKIIVQQTITIVTVEIKHS